MFGQVLRSSIKPLPMRLLSREFSTIQNIKHQKIEVPAYKYINNQINMRTSSIDKSVERIADDISSIRTEITEFKKEVKEDIKNIKKDILPSLITKCGLVIVGSFSFVELVSFISAQNGYDFRVIYWNYGKPNTENKIKTSL